LLQGPDRPTAIITLGTHMLAGVMDALASNGLRYPNDMSLVCIGDTDLARHATPGISALTWDLDQMGRVAANILLDRIRGGDEARKIRPVYLPTRFILRHSGAKPHAP
jgi:LacI family transcriptional regulator